MAFACAAHRLNPSRPIRTRRRIVHRTTVVAVAAAAEWSPWAQKHASHSALHPAPRRDHDKHHDTHPLRRWAQSQGAHVGLAEEQSAALTPPERDPSSTPVPPSRPRRIVHGTTVVAAAPSAHAHPANGALLMAPQRSFLHRPPVRTCLITRARTWARLSIGDRCCG
ncbi:hypothetical protein BKA93DRAFT_12876 [Sparassis latifolia]